jgi:hypothetical protein
MRDDFQRIEKETSYYKLKKISYAELKEEMEEKLPPLVPFVIEANPLFKKHRKHLWVTQSFKLTEVNRNHKITVGIRGFPYELEFYWPRYVKKKWEPVRLFVKSCTDEPVPKKRCLLVVKIMNDPAYPHIYTGTLNKLSRKQYVLNSYQGWTKATGPKELEIQLSLTIFNYKSAPHA